MTAAKEAAEAAVGAAKEVAKEEVEGLRTELAAAVELAEGVKKEVVELQGKLEAAAERISGASNRKEKIAHLEKVKRELAEIKDAKTHLEEELDRKNKLLMSGEEEGGLDDVSEAGLDDVLVAAEEDAFDFNDDESASYDPSEEATGMIPTAALKQAAAAAYEFHEGDSIENNVADSPVVMRPRRTRRALASISDNEVEVNPRRPSKVSVIAEKAKKTAARRSARTRESSEDASPPKRRRCVFEPFLSRF